MKSLPCCQGRVRHSKGLGVGDQGNHPEESRRALQEGMVLERTEECLLLEGKEEGWQFCL